MRSFQANKTNRRKFFSTAGKSTLGLILISSLSGKLFGKSKKVQKLKDVNPHPKAVKRVN
ncbi:MAG: hypothetical protein ABFS12_15030 [Bacteroidota bacterium]